MDFNDRDQVISRLNELKAMKLPHVTIEKFAELSKTFARDIGCATDDERKAIIDELNKYYRPNDDNKCVFSGRSPSLEWGLSHGVAIDRNTGLSWVCYHYFTIGGYRNRYDVTLQYHPDGYEIGDE